MIQLEKSEDNILYFKKFIDDYCANGLDVKKIEELLYYFQPLDFENNRLVNIIVNENSKQLPFFNTKKSKIVINIVGLFNFLKYFQNGFEYLYGEKNLQRCSGYLILLVIIHELEHSYQFFMGEKKLESPCNLVSEGYKLIFNYLDFPTKNNVNIIKWLISIICYKNREGFSVIERNANIEAVYVLNEVARYCEEDDIYEFFTKLKNSYLSGGYYKNVNGSMEETINVLKLQDFYAKFDHNIALSMEDRVRYGLQIDEETRKKILALDQFKVKK